MSDHCIYDWHPVKPDRLCCQHKDHSNVILLGTSHSVLVLIEMLRLGILKGKAHQDAQKIIGEIKKP